MTLTCAVCAALLLPATPRATNDDELVASRTTTRAVDASRFEVFHLGWRRPVVRTGVFRTVGTSFGAPAVSKRHGLVIVGNGDGSVIAVEEKDGTLRWRYQYGAPFSSSTTLLTIDNAGQSVEVAILGSLDAHLLAVNVATGELLWKSEIDGIPRAPARVVGSRLLVTTANNKVVLIDGHTGNKLWVKGRPASSGLTVDGHGAAAAALGRVYASFADGYVESYKLEDGGLVWSRPLSISGGKFIDADADPVLLDGRLYVASYSDGIYALNPEDGQTLWSRVAPAVTTLAVHESLLIAGSADGWVWGLHAATGDLAYRTRMEPGQLSRLLVKEGRVVLTAGPSGLIVLDAVTGKPLQSYPIGSAFSGDVSMAGDCLAFLNSAGFLYTMQMKGRPQPH